MTISVVPAPFSLRLRVCSPYSSWWAAYLPWLGNALWRGPCIVTHARRENDCAGTPDVLECLHRDDLESGKHVFFIALFTAVRRHAQPVFMQFVILETTFLIQAAASVAAWAPVAAHLPARLPRPPALRSVNGIGAGFLIGGGLPVATTRRIGR